jgi:hypothetical protein
MTKMKTVLTALAVSMILMATAAGIQAATLRAFVSSTGNDANAATNCAQANPCRTFAGAFPTVTAGGELIALDTAGYGPLTGGNTINKSITIAAIPGQTAFVVAAAGTAGFTVGAAAGDMIILRNLSFNGSGAAGTFGIQHISGRLMIKDCTFAQLSTGLNVTNAKADVLDSEFTGNNLAISVSGAGWDVNNPNTPATALVTLQGGSIKFNATALNMTNVAVASGQNIWIFSTGNIQSLTGIAQNATFMASSGGVCPCNFPGFYQPGSSNPK